jgi:hypothetical protein
LQLGIVFTAKTFGLQAVELLKPLIAKYFHGCPRPPGAVERP